MATKKAAEAGKKPGYQIEFRRLADLRPYGENARTHSPEQVAEIAASIVEFGWTNPILADGEGMIVAGHGRRLAAMTLFDRGALIRLPSGEELPAGVVPVIDCTGWSARQKRAYILADNQIALNADWDLSVLKGELTALESDGLDLAAAGFSADALAAIFREESAATAGASLAELFGVVPFSVFNAREGWWQDRKRAWLALGIRSEIGRGENLLRFSETINEPNPAKRAANGRRKAAASGQDIMRGENVVGGNPAPARAFSTKEWVQQKGLSGMAGETPGAGTSIFDPVLCEIAYRWFCPEGGQVLDPFAGGSVRGVVAGYLGRRYCGIELRGEQVAANRDQAAEIIPAAAVEWIEGDSRDAGALLPAEFAADFLFSCPPYADLEIYSDDPRDLSTMAYGEFRAVYGEIIAAAASRLRADRFACFVVGDIRDKAGAYRNFVGHTIEAFEAAGLRLYNEAILVTAAGSLPIRVRKQFEGGRKLGKTHQNVLIFIKGDWRKAVGALAPPEFGAIIGGEEEA